MKLTKVQLRQLIKEEMGLLLQEQRRRKQKCLKNSSLWKFLQARIRDKALDGWKDELLKKNNCVALADIADAAGELVGSVHGAGFWKRKETFAREGCVGASSRWCGYLKTVLEVRKKMYAAAIKSNKGFPAQAKNQLTYLITFYGVTHGNIEPLFKKVVGKKYRPPPKKAAPAKPKVQIPCDKADPMKLKSVGTYEKLNRKEAIAEYYAKTNEAGLSKERFERMLDVIKSKSTINRWEAVANDVCKWTYKYDKMIAAAKRKKVPYTK